MPHLLITLQPSIAGFSFTAAQARMAGIFVICLILAVTVHEFSHALCAHRLGDPTPEGEGRLTLNPMVHADPIGTLVLPLILAVTAPGMLFGWGRPVNTQPRHYTRKVTMRGGMAMVAFAGPLSNLVMAALTLGVAWLLANFGVIEGPMSPYHPLRLFFSLNLLLFVFNLLPIHPLDGGKVLGWVLGPRYEHVDAFLLRYGGIIIIVLVLSPIPILGYLLGPFNRWGDLLFRAAVL